MLPNEHDHRAQIARRLDREFALARRALTLALDMLGGRDGTIQIYLPGLDQNTISVSLCLFSKLCKLHRAIVALSELGRDSEAEVLIRTFFESFLIFEFLLRHRVVLKRNGRVISPPTPLTARLRSRLYVAKYYLELTKLVRLHEETPGLRRIGARMNKRAVFDRLREVERSIGPEWTRILRRPNASGSFDLFGVRSLAESLGHLAAYNQTYKHFSLQAHGFDALSEHNYDPKDGALRFFVHPPQVEPPLRASTGLLALAMRRMNKRFRLGYEREIVRLQGDL